MTSSIIHKTTLIVTLLVGNEEIVAQKCFSVMAVSGSLASNRNLRRRTWLLLLVAILVLGEVQTASSNQVLGASVTEWVVPTAQSGPWGLKLDQTGSCCWFVEYYGNKIGHFDSKTGSFQEWEIPTPNSNPYSIAITSLDGKTMVWGTEFASSKVFAFLPTNGEFNEYSIPGPGGPASISIEPQPSTVRVWFTQPTSNSNGEFVYDPSSGNVTLYEDRFPVSVGGGAYDVHAFSGSVWFAGFSSIVRWDRASGDYTIWPLPVHNGAVGRFITFDSLGQVWYTQGVAGGSSNDNFVGVLHGNIIQEWRLPQVGANPRGVAVDPLTQQPWVAEQSTLKGNGTVANLKDFGNGALFNSSPLTAPSAPTATVLSPTISYTSASNNSVTPVTHTVVASGKGPFTGYVLGPTLPSDVIADSSGNVWVSEPAANKIVRISPSSPDYALSPASYYVSLAQASSISIEVTATSVSGYAGDLTFTAPDLPAGITISTVNPNSVHVPSGGNVSFNLAIYTSPRASPGMDLITIEASDGTTSHTIGVILTITNSTAIAQKLETRCLITVPILLPQSTLLVGLLIDVSIGSLYIGLPSEYFSRKLRLIGGLSRRSWLIILLLAPSLLSVGSTLLLLC
jgi:streptogramin lyase